MGSPEINGQKYIDGYNWSYTMLYLYMELL